MSQAKWRTRVPGAETAQEIIRVARSYPSVGAPYWALIMASTTIISRGPPHICQVAIFLAGIHMTVVVWRVLAETERRQAAVLRRSLRLRAGARDLNLCFGGEDGAERLG